MKLVCLFYCFKYTNILVLTRLCAAVYLIEMTVTEGSQLHGMCTRGRQRTKIVARVGDSTLKM